MKISAQGAVMGFDHNWSISAVLNRRAYREAQAELNRRYREAIDKMTPPLELNRRWADLVEQMAPQGWEDSKLLYVLPCNHDHRLDAVMSEPYYFAGNGTTRSESMRESYGEAKIGSAGNAQAADIRGAREASALESLVKQIHSRINEIEGRQQVSDSALARLVDPRPIGVKQPDRMERAHTSNDTHESALRMIVERLDQLYANAERQADILNSAV